MVKGLRKETTKVSEKSSQTTFALETTGDTCVRSTTVKMKTLHRDVMDATGLELSMERRAKILYALNVNHNQKHRKLASEEIPVTEFLFGNNLKSFLSAIDSSSKLGFSMTRSHRERKYFPNHTKN